MSVHVHHGWASSCQRDVSPEPLRPQPVDRYRDNNEFLAKTGSSLHHQEHPLACKVSHCTNVQSDWVTEESLWAKSYEIYEFGHAIALRSVQTTAEQGTTVFSHAAWWCQFILLDATTPLPRQLWLVTRWLCLEACCEDLRELVPTGQSSRIPIGTTNQNSRALDAIALTTRRDKVMSSQFGIAWQLQRRRGREDIKSRISQIPRNYPIEFWIHCSICRLT